MNTHGTSYGILRNSYKSSQTFGKILLTGLKRHFLTWKELENYKDLISRKSLWEIISRFFKLCCSQDYPEKRSCSDLTQNLQRTKFDFAQFHEKTTTSGIYGVLTNFFSYLQRFSQIITCNFTEFSQLFNKSHFQNFHFYEIFQKTEILSESARFQNKLLGKERLRDWLSRKSSVFGYVLISWCVVTAKYLHSASPCENILEVKVWKKVKNIF